MCQIVSLNGFLGMRIQFGLTKKAEWPTRQHEAVKLGVQPLDV